MHLATFVMPKAALRLLARLRSELLLVSRGVRTRLLVPPKTQTLQAAR